jgi:hypothetical protein
LILLYSYSGCLTALFLLFINYDYRESRIR